VLCFALQGVPNNYETDLIYPIVSKAAELAGLDYSSAPPTAQTALKVIGDHARAVVYLVGDGVLPSNVGRGYVVRRLLRRVIMKVRGWPEVDDIRVKVVSTCSCCHYMQLWCRKLHLEACSVW
jgi:alanyl-tRNA synthetase